MIKTTFAILFLLISFSSAQGGMWNRIVENVLPSNSSKIARVAVVSAGVAVAAVIAVISATVSTVSAGITVSAPVIAVGSGVVAVVSGGVEVVSLLGE